MFRGFGLGAAEEFGRISFMFAAVFSCVTISTSAGNSTLPLTWSPCVCVLTTIMTGWFVTFLIASSSGCPHPGFFVSTTMTPFWVMKTELLPPPPFMTYRLSLSLSISTTIGACPAGCCTAAAVNVRAPDASRTPSTIPLLMDASLSGADHTGISR